MRIALREIVHLENPSVWKGCRTRKGCGVEEGAALLVQAPTPALRWHIGEACLGCDKEHSFAPESVQVVRSEREVACSPLSQQLEEAAIQRRHETLVAAAHCAD